MSNKYKNRYRISSMRMKYFNYASAGMYFITICTKNRKRYFGKILNGKMYPSTLGKVVHSEWSKTPEIRNDMNVALGEFVVMPDHFHAILIIGENPFNGPIDVRKNSGNAFQPQSKNLASVIRGFKSAVTTYARKNKMDFNWQTRYHDIIIRDHSAFRNISNYIRRNPKNWKGK